jgi:hypothetical protein
MYVFHTKKDAQANVSPVLGNGIYYGRVLRSGHSTSKPSGQQQQAHGFKFGLGKFLVQFLRFGAVFR